MSAGFVLNVPALSGASPLPHFEGVHKSNCGRGLAPDRALENPAKLGSELIECLEIGLAHHFLRLVRAIPWPWADFRVVAAGIRALVINSAKARLTIQVQAVVVAHALQGEDLGFAVVALDDAFLLQALGDVLRRVATLEFIDDANADQVFDLHFDRQRAATGHAAPAHVGGIFLPGLETVEFRGGDQLRLHQGSKVGRYPGAGSYRD
jgi:hypothetical protein